MNAIIYGNFVLPTEVDVFLVTNCSLHAGQYEGDGQLRVALLENGRERVHRPVDAVETRVVSHVADPEDVVGKIAKAGRKDDIMVVGQRRLDCLRPSWNLEGRHGR